LVLIRTFSKAFNMAGIRLGYLIARPDLAKTIENVKLPFSVGPWQQAAGELILNQTPFRERIVKRIIKERGRVEAALKAIPGIVPVPSQTNFVLFEIKSGQPAEIIKDLARNGVLVRTFDHPRLKNHARVTIGTPAENSVFLRTLAQAIKVASREGDSERS